MYCTSRLDPLSISKPELNLPSWSNGLQKRRIVHGGELRCGCTHDGVSEGEKDNPSAAQEGMTDEQGAPMNIVVFQRLQYVRWSEEAPPYKV